MGSIRPGLEYLWPCVFSLTVEMFSLTVFIGSAMHFQDARSFDVCLIPSFLGIVFGAAFHRGVFIFELCMYFMGEKKVVGRRCWSYRWLMFGYFGGGYPVSPPPP